MWTSEAEEESLIPTHQFLCEQLRKLINFLKSPLPHQEIGILVSNHDIVWTKYKILAFVKHLTHFLTK